MTGEINAEVVSKTMFGRMVNEFKAWLSNIVKNIAELKNTIWKGAGRAFEQALAFAAEVERCNERTQTAETTGIQDGGRTNSETARAKPAEEKKSTVRRRNRRL